MNQINYEDNRFLMFILDQMAYDYEKKGQDVIRLTLGKSELPLRDEIIRAMQDATNDYKKYSVVFPAGLPELKEKLAKQYNNKYNTSIRPSNVIVSLGTSSIFRNLFQMTLSEGDEVLIPNPYYSLYKFSALLVGAKIRYYNINLNDRSIDIKSFEENISEHTKIVVINNPGNPLGNIITESELYTIDSIVNRRALIISDEIYSNVCFYKPSLSLVQLKSFRSSYVVTNAFSKGYRMYSRRVGYCIVPDNLVTPLTVVQHHTLLTVDPVAQYGALVAMDFPDEVSELTELYKTRSEYTIQKLKSISDIKVIPPNGGFYIVLDCTEYSKKRGYKNSLSLAEDILRQVYVATVPGDDFGLPFMLRLSFSERRYNEAINRLSDFFSNR